MFFEIFLLFISPFAIFMFFSIVLISPKQQFKCSASDFLSDLNYYKLSYGCWNFLNPLIGELDSRTAFISNIFFLTTLFLWVILPLLINQSSTLLIEKLFLDFSVYLSYFSLTSFSLASYLLLVLMFGSLNYDFSFISYFSPFSFNFN